MARQLVQIMWDDLDRQVEADEVIEFGWEGVNYVLDLTTEHADEFRAFIQPYLNAAHEKVKIPKLPAQQRVKAVPTQLALPAGKARETATKVAAEQTDHSAPGWSAKERAIPDPNLRAKIREWGRQRGYDVKRRGILPAEVTAAYMEEHANV